MKIEDVIRCELKYSKTATNNRIKQIEERVTRLKLLGLGALADLISADFLYLLDNNKQLREALEWYEPLLVAVSVQLNRGDKSNQIKEAYSQMAKFEYAALLLREDGGHRARVATGKDKI